MTATSMCSLSPSPPSLLVCINRSSRAHAEITDRGRYGVNLLSVGQRSVALHCSRIGGDKHLRDDWLAADAPEGATPRLLGALAHLECEVATSFEVYSHTVFLGLIHRAWVNPVDAPPLLYHGGSYSQLESAASDRAAAAGDAGLTQGATPRAATSRRRAILAARLDARRMTWTSSLPITAGRPTGRAVVTGGAGFVGSHLVDRLVRDGWTVLVIDDLSTGRAHQLPDTARLERLDVAVDPSVRSSAPGVRTPSTTSPRRPASGSIRDPVRDLAVNVSGTHRVAAAARAAGAERLVFVSSGGAIYGETTRAATERTTPAPTSYYGIHKLAAEGHVALAGLPFAIARPSNIYGPRQTAGLEGAVVATLRRPGAGRHAADRRRRRPAETRSRPCPGRGRGLVRLGDPAAPAAPGTSRRGAPSRSKHWRRSWSAAPA